MLLRHGGWLLCRWSDACCEKCVGLTALRACRLRRGWLRGSRCKEVLLLGTCGGRRLRCQRLLLLGSRGSTKERGRCLLRLNLLTLRRDLRLGLGCGAKERLGLLRGGLHHTALPGHRLGLRSSPEERLLRRRCGELALSCTELLLLLTGGRAKRVGLLLLSRGTKRVGLLRLLRRGAKRVYLRLLSGRSEPGLLGALGLLETRHLAGARFLHQIGRCLKSGGITRHDQSLNRCDDGGICALLGQKCGCRAPRAGALRAVDSAVVVAEATEAFL